MDVGAELGAKATQGLGYEGFMGDPDWRGGLAIRPIPSFILAETAAQILESLLTEPPWWSLDMGVRGALRVMTGEHLP